MCHDRNNYDTCKMKYVCDNHKMDSEQEYGAYIESIMVQPVLNHDEMAKAIIVIFYWYHKHEQQTTGLDLLRSINRKVRAHLNDHLEVILQSVESEETPLFDCIKEHFGLGSLQAYGL